MIKSLVLNTTFVIIFQGLNHVHTEPQGSPRVDFEHTVESPAVLLTYYFQCHSESAKFPLSSVSPLYIPSILFKKDSFPVEFVLYADG
jgi:hypothetical protein